MLPPEKRDYQPSDAFRRAARKRFLREARSRYGRPSASRWLDAPLAAAAVLGALGLWWLVQEPQTPTEPPDVAQVDEVAQERTARDSRVRDWTTRDARVIGDAGARWRWTEARRILLESGRLYLDVEPTGGPFEIHNPSASVKVIGTRLVVSADAQEIRVGVGSGRASLENAAGSVSLGPGERGVARGSREPRKDAGRRFSYLAEFIADAFDDVGPRDLGRSADFVYGTARVPVPNGQTSSLGVVRYHLDVHIEDGMARTTIDQTFYNPSWNRVEGTFLFPLPPDASISRLAMYVDGKLMEGGMAERSRAVEVFERIVQKMKDPAILEWMEGSTFRLRIFPFEPHSERRIILSYQQSLESLYEMDRYRFPFLRPSTDWGEFSIRVLVKAASRWEISTPTYPLERVAESESDVEFAFEKTSARPAKDLIVEMRRPRRPPLDYASHEASGARTICVTAAPEISADVYRGPRRVLLVADRSGNASEAERRAQMRMARSILRALDRKDRINVLAYSTEARVWRGGFARRSKANLSSAIDFLEKEAFLGAGDLEAAFRRAGELFGEPRDGDVIFYIGDGIDTISGLEPERIAAILPPEVPFLAIPVNRSFDRPLLGALAARSGGRVIPVSPDDRIAWRAFDLVASLRTPAWRKLSWELLDGDGNPVPGTFHADRAMLRDGETVRIAGRIDGPWPRFLRLQGKRLNLGERRTGCGWIPRLWAKLRIEALERDSAAEHRKEIVRLGKEHYVMTPFTSLLVLENDAMYKQYNIDRGRRDHWALYAAPSQWHGKVRAPRWDATSWRWLGPPNTVWLAPRNGVWSVSPNTVWSVSPNGVWCLWPDEVLSTVPNAVYSRWSPYRVESQFGFPGQGTAGTVIPINPVSGQTGFAPLKKVYWNWASAPMGPPVGVNVDVLATGAVPVVQGPGTSLVPGFEAITFNLSFGDDPLATPFVLTHENFLNAIDLGVANTASGSLTVLWNPIGALPSGVGPENIASGKETKRLEEYLSGKGDLAVSFAHRRAAVFESGERLLLQGGRAVYLDKGWPHIFDPLFDSILARDPAAIGEWARLPWFLLPIEALAGSARVTEREEGDRTVLGIERPGLTTIEIVFEGERPVEVRVVLTGGLVLRRAVYDDWEEIGGRWLPARAAVYGPGGAPLDEMVYRYGMPESSDREWLARLRDAARAGEKEGGAAQRDLASALALYRAGDRARLETFLKQAFDDERATVALRKVARLAAIRWDTSPCIDAPMLDARAPDVRRWLPSEPPQLERALERSLASGDVTSLAALILSTEEPQRCVASVERLRQEVPDGLRGLMDLWLGELASRQGWKLKAYEAFARARNWKPLAESVPLLDRLCELALAMNEPETAFGLAEEALVLLESKHPAMPLGPRLAKLVELSRKREDLWKARGEAILARWAAAAPRDPKPFAQLAELHRGAGRPAPAIRYASQSVELKPSRETYAALAQELERIGDPARADACRRIAERFKK